MGKESDISTALIEEKTGYTPRARAVVMGRQPLWMLYAKEDGTKAYRRKSPKELIEEAVEKKRVVKVDDLLSEYKVIQEAKLSEEVISKVLKSIGWKYDKEKNVYRRATV